MAISITGHLTMNTEILNLLNLAECLAANDKSLDPNIHACLQLTRLDIEHWMNRTHAESMDVELAHA